MWNNNSFGESYTFGCKKPFALAICEECIGKTFDLAFVSLNLVPSQKSFSCDVLSGLVEKTKQTYVLPLLEKCHSTIVNVDLTRFLLWLLFFWNQIGSQSM